jgi:sulfite exporter TauE/SafE
MCSPLVMTATGTGKRAIVRNLQYNFGRILTYGIMGSAVSFLGKGLHVAGLQQWVSILAGLTLLTIAVLNIQVAIPAYVQGRISRSTNILRNNFRPLLSRRDAFATTLLGMINGILPCGMTLIALGYCITLPGPIDGFIAMLVFGAGTLPAMIGFAAIVKSIVGRFNISYSTLQSTLIIACAFLLIGRGVWESRMGHDDVNGNPEIVVCGIGEP